MASFIFFLLFSLLTATTTAAATVAAPTFSPSPLLQPQPPSTSHKNTTTVTPFSLLPQPPSSSAHNSAQLNSIIDAIVGATDFSNWANLLPSADVSTIPLSATLFITDDDRRPPITAAANPLLHVIPRRFSFSELQLFPTGARLPTLVPGTTLLITNNSAVNFTINSAKLIKPDMYQNAIVSVHGLDSLLSPPANQAELRNSRQRRQPRRKRPRDSPPSEANPQSPKPPEVSVGAKPSCSWHKVAATVVLVLVVLHFLGFPKLHIVCIIDHGSSAQGHFRYSAGCSGNFVI
ncbi:hypothetical protein RND81_02G012200 [Saponaria officinalis]|uniref:FAS1 domain-containing protein n=1 Tax=Saponaria officinalis TaxID=3572 RepID=A0AAW1MQ89_SAPOF